MVEIIYGRARSGKTYMLTQKISDCIKEGKECVLIVPEQYTLESERELIRVIGVGSSEVEVLSFTRLFEIVLSKFGGQAGDIASDSQRVILMSRAIESVRDNFKYFTRRKATPEFCAELITAVNEFKTCACSFDELKDVNDKLTNGRLKDKFNDILLVANAYDSLLKAKYIDPMDNLKKLYEMLTVSDYFVGKHVFFDSFKGFTGQQFKVIAEIIRASSSCCFAFASDGNFSDETGVFASVNSAIRKIVDISKKLGIEVLQPECVGEPRYNSDDLAALERYISSRKRTEINAQNIHICSCRDANEEAAFAAEIIRKTVREKGYRFRDFAVIARDSSLYSSAISIQFEKSGVPVFSDYRYPASSLPLLVFASSAVKSVSSFSTENILRFIKSGLSALNSEEISDLENYVYIWRIEGKKWFKEWNMDPEGMAFREKENLKEVTEFLDYINELRIKAITPLIDFKNDFNGTAVDMGKALFQLAVNCDVQNKLLALADKYEADKEYELAENTRMSWGVFCDILDNTVSCMEGQTVGEFESIFDCALSFTTVGRVPRRPDEVIFGDADRIRPSRPKVVIALGMNRGIFPANVSGSGIFAPRERNELVRLGVPLPDRMIDSVLEENYLVYNTLCCASDELFITYSLALGGEYNREPSRAVEMVKNLFKNISTNKYDEIIKSNVFLPETEESALERMALLMGDGGELFDSIADVLLQDSNFSASVISKNGGVSEVKDIQNSMREKRISSENAKRLFGNDLYVSATRFDKFNRCRFSYFCDYGLKAKVLQPAEVDVKQKGLIIHYVLEKMFTRFGKELHTLSVSAIKNEVSGYIKEYVNGISGAESITDPKFKFMLSRIETVASDIVCHLAREFEQSKFEPVACELSIGGEFGVEPPKIKLSTGGEVRIVGSIDRVDKYNEYIRVVDYKTGTKTFKLPDIVHGLNMQMLLYLYSVAKSNDKDYCGTLPAGVLYLPAKRSLDGENSLCMSGILLDDENVATAMERDNNGVYIPKRVYDKNGAVKGEKYITDDEFQAIFNHLEDMLINMGEQLHSGVVDINPIDGCESEACKYCDFAAVCLLKDAEHMSVEKLSKAEVFEKIGGGDDDGV